MKGAFRLLVVLALLAVLCLAGFRAPAWTEDIFLFREHFQDLRNWQDLYFPKIHSHSTYTLERKDGLSCLRTESNASASALVHKTTFDVNDFPRARWRWNVQNLYRKGDPRKKEGDDYPLRVYVMFEYRPEQAGAWQRLQYALARRVYGEYPPGSTLGYVWANKDAGTRILESPYTDRAKMIVLEQGPARLGTWQDEEVNMLADYRAAFGSDPPGKARIAVMNDSDDTGEASVSRLQYIEVFRETARP